MPSFSLSRMGSLFCHSLCFLFGILFLLSYFDISFLVSLLLLFFMILIWDFVFDF
ncbi:hypothetical protein Scep_029634 [Stephania cephalantha]|uniref:Uncharacterized protein n=1 Tax=Stephania cephalantha TaxID=152367 RepID=A0AAP0E1D6_9MAGN